MTCWFEEGEERKRGRESRFSFRSVPPAFALLFLPSLSSSPLLFATHRPRHAARASESSLGRHEHVRHVLVLGQQRQVQQDLDGLSVGGHNDELGDAAVERLGRCLFLEYFYCFCGGRDRSIGREREPVSHMLLSIGLGVEARAHSEWDLLNFRGGGSGG
jgi:hypothetical protein